MNTDRHSIFTGNKRFVIAIFVIAGALWLSLVVYVLTDDGRSEHYVKPGEVAVQAPSPVASNVPTIRPAQHTSPMLFSHHGGATTVSPSVYSFVPISQGASSNGYPRLFETSSAKAHTIGSGIGVNERGVGGNGIGWSNNSGNSQERGIHSTALAGGGTIHLALPSVRISEPGATNAPLMASIVTEEGPRAAPKVRNLYDDPLDPFLDPVGDVAWGLMAVLGMVWCARVYRRRRLRKQSV